MNVLMINNEFPPLGGGTASVNANLLDALADDSSLAIELVTSSGGAATSISDHCENTRIHRVKVKKQASPHHAKLIDLISFMISALPYSMRLHRHKQFDLVFAWATLPAGLVAWLIKRLNGTPYIVRVSGPDIPGWEKRYSFITKFFAPIIRMVWRGAAITTAKCEQEREAVLKHCKGLKVALLPTAVPSTNRSSRKIDKYKVKFLCVARLIARKRHQLLLRSLALLPLEIEWTLSLVGTGDEESNLLAIVRELSLESKVRFFGYVDRASVNELYQEHDVFISLSENESMSVAALEALASGMPCLLAQSAAQGLTENMGIKILYGGDSAIISAEVKQALNTLESIRSTFLEPQYLPCDMAKIYKESFAAAVSTSGV